MTFLQSTSRFVRFLTGHAFLRKHNAYVKYNKKPNQVIPFDEIKCRMCGEASEEPAHIIRECEAFAVERLEEFGYLEWHEDIKWSVDQMIHFLNRTRVKDLEEENLIEE